LTTQSRLSRIGILGSADSPYVKELQRAAIQLGSVEVQLMRFGELQTSLGVSMSSVAPDSGLVVPEACSVDSLRSPTVDGLIVRSMPLGTLEQVIFRMDCLQVWESRGVAVVNPPRSLEVAIDKWLTLHRLHQVGVAVPPTIACQSRTAAIAAMQELGGDVLIKPLFGGEGRGIIRLQDKDTAWRVLGTVQQIGQVLYVQQFAEHFGYDIRVLFVGERVFSVKRHAVGDSWRTNLAQGSTAEPHTLTDQERDIAKRAAAAVGGSVLGVDLLPCRDGRLLTLEVNAVPGWRGLGKALDVDIAMEVLAHVRSLATATAARHAI
jgi:tetrahydromethanopterin:alpha-L-glutamate ligase